ncbi:MAG: biotin/lipoyl-binding protein [Lachnospiraceae bacterium]|nr:biotin/lipoyl-binding protein [Lachnospiraceae bacterium]
MRSIFRKTALEKISSPDQLDRVIEITPPLFWLAVIGIAVMLASALIWSIAGRIPENVNASGIYMTTDGLKVIYSGQTGIIEKIWVTDGQKVKKGDIIADFSNGDPKSDMPETRIKSSCDGYLIGMNITEGQFVTQGSAICSIVAENVYDLFGGEGDNKDTDEAGDNGPGFSGRMAAILYVDVDSGKKIKKGMDVKIYPSTVNKQEYGHILAKVDHVDEYVTGMESIKNRLGDEALAQSFAGNGPVVQVVCRMDSDASTKSGYKWSGAKGAEVSLSPGTLLTADIVTDKKAPITMLLPVLKEKLAGGTGTKEGY